MEKSKIDKVINAFRNAMYQEFSVEDSVNEEGMVANAPGTSGGFSGSSPAAGPTAGFDPVMKMDGRRKYVKKYLDKLTKDREKRAERKRKKEASKFNPFFTNNG